MSIAIVTGAGRRLGKAIAIDLAKNGFDIVIHYNSSESGAIDASNIIQKLGRKAYLFQADLTKVSEIEKMFKKIKEIFKTAKILVNNAAIFPPKKKLNEVTENDWNQLMEINLKSIYFTSQQFANISDDDGRIINISSLGGIEIWKERILYNISKSSVIQLTRALSRELAPKISVNTVCPGQIVFEKDIKEIDKTLIDINKIPMGRYGLPDDVAQAVRFFATATSYITGQCLVVDGGYHFAH